MPVTAAVGLAVSQLLHIPVVKAASNTALDKAGSIIQKHFLFNGNEMFDAFQNSFKYALSAIAASLVSDATLSFKVKNSAIVKSFAKQIQSDYLNSFQKSNRNLNLELDEMSQIALLLAKNVDKVVFVEDFVQPSIPSLLKEDSKHVLSAILINLIRAYLVNTKLAKSKVTEVTLLFMEWKGLVAKATNYFFYESLRNDQRVRDTFNALQNEGIWCSLKKVQKNQVKMKGNVERINSSVELLQENVEEINSSVELLQENLQLFEKRVQFNIEGLFGELESIESSLLTIDETTKDTNIKVSKILDIFDEFVSSHSNMLKLQDPGIETLKDGRFRVKNKQLLFSQLKIIIRERVSEVLAEKEKKVLHFHEAEEITGLIEGFFLRFGGKVPNDIESTLKLSLATIAPTQKERIKLLKAVVGISGGTTGIAMIVGGIGLALGWGSGVVAAVVTFFTGASLAGPIAWVAGGVGVATIAAYFALSSNEEANTERFLSALKGGLRKAIGIE